MQHDDNDDDYDDETHNDDKTQRDGFEAKHAARFVNVIYFHNTLNYFARMALGTIGYKDAMDVVIPLYHY